MYQLRFGSTILYDPRGANEIDNLYIAEPSTHLEVGTAGSMAFSLPANNPSINKLKRMMGLIELKDGNIPIYRGRIIRDTRSFDNSVLVETEGAMAFLNDSLCPPFSFPDDFLSDQEYKEAAENGNVVDFLFRWLLKKHNDQVLDYQKILPGVVTVSDPNNYIKRSMSEHTKTIDILREKLEKLLGGYFLIRYEDDANYLDYFADLPLTNVQPVKFASNLLDVSREIDGTEIYTCITPIGSDGLDLSDLPDGDYTSDIVKSGDMIYSRSGIETYGKINKFIKWDDITIADNLLKKSAALLASSGIYSTETITCQAIDLSCTDTQIQAWRVGRYTMVDSSPHGIDLSYALMAMDLNILDPGSTTVTLGSTKKTLTGSTIAESKNKNEIFVDFGEKLEESKKEISEINKTTSELISKVEQASGKIETEVSRIDTAISGTTEIIQKMQSSITQLDDEVSITIRKEITEIQGDTDDLKQKTQELEKKVAIKEDGLTISAGDNAPHFNADNDAIKIVSNGQERFRADEQGVSTPKLNADEVHIGKFAWISWDYGGEKRFSLRKVG